MTSSSANVQRDVDKLTSNISHLSKDMKEIQEENKSLHEEIDNRAHALKTTKIVKETISTDPDSNEITTERESTTYVEEVGENWFITQAKLYLGKLNPMNGKGSIFSRTMKAIVVSLLMMGTVYAVWNGLKGVGIIRGSWSTKIENLAWGVYKRIPFLPYAVGSVRGFIAGLFTGKPEPTVKPLQNEYTRYGGEL